MLLLVFTAVLLGLARVAETGRTAGMWWIVAALAALGGFS